jgi:hypothetical protein
MAQVLLTEAILHIVTNDLFPCILSFNMFSNEKSTKYALGLFIRLEFIPILCLFYFIDSITFKA